MTIADVNAIIRTYLTTASVAVNPLIALVGERIYWPRLPENIKLTNLAADISTPAISFFTRGGTSTPYIPGMPEPSVQFDCWATDVPPISGPIRAREVYRKLYDALQGIQNVTVGAYKICSAIEEVQGQDLVDTDIQGYFRTLAFFRIMIRAE